MLRFNADMRGLTAAAQELGAMPAQIHRARKSALSSTAWMAKGELQNHVEYGGSGWAKLHPMTLKYRKRKGSTPPTPLYFLGRFARYRVDAGGSLADIDFGKSKAGRPGTYDRDLVDMVRRHEKGLTIPVTEKMRGFFGATRPKGRRGKRAVPGRDYFPLKRSTTHITIPARKIFGPVWRKIQPKLAPHFNGKFQAAIVRYLSGGAKA